MRIFSEPPKKIKSNKEIFKSINKLVEENYPSNENDHPIFKQFGRRTGGMADTWLLKKDWKLNSEADKWKYVAYCALYWEERYRYWYESLQYETYKNYLLETAKEHPEFMETYNFLVEKEKE